MTEDNHEHNIDDKKVQSITVKSSQDADNIEDRKQIEIRLEALIIEDPGRNNEEKASKIRRIYSQIDGYASRRTKGRGTI